MHKGGTPQHPHMGSRGMQQGAMMQKGGTPQHQHMGSRGMQHGMSSLGGFHNMQQQIVPNSANSQRIQHSSGSLPGSRKSLSASFSSSMRGSTAGSNWDGQTNLDDDDNVRVVVRCRPMNENERNRNDRQVLFVEDSQTAVTLRAPGGGRYYNDFIFLLVSPLYTSILTHIPNRWKRGHEKLSFQHVFSSKNNSGAIF